MCILDESVGHMAAIMALGALLIMLINVWQARHIENRKAEVLRLIDEAAAEARVTKYCAKP